MAELQPIIVFHSCHFSAILEFVIGFLSNFYNWCPMSLRTIRWKNEVSILINGWVTVKYSVSRPPFCPPSWNLYSDLCKTLIGYVRYHFEQFRTKMASLSQTVSWGPQRRHTHIQTDRHTHKHTHTHMTIA